MFHYYAPLDPACPAAANFREELFSDPITEAYGAPVGDILDDFERRHRQSCQRCQRYGVANIEVRE